MARFKIWILQIANNCARRCNHSSENCSCPKSLTLQIKYLAAVSSANRYLPVG